MPFQNFICEVTGEPTPPQACLACARSGALPGCPMTAPVVKGILANMRPDDFGVTITTLLGCPRKFQLKQEVDYNLRPSEMWWAYRGQLMHDVSARYAQDDPNAVVEQRYSVMVEAPEGAESSSSPASPTWCTWIAATSWTSRPSKPSPVPGGLTPARKPAR